MLGPENNGILGLLGEPGHPEPEGEGGGGQWQRGRRWWWGEWRDETEEPRSLPTGTQPLVIVFFVKHRETK